MGSAKVVIMATGKPTVYTVKDVKPDAFVRAFAKYLKRSGKIELPSYVDVVKTGVAKELGPYDPDWFYVRAASIARRCYVRPGAGVGTFRRIYSTTYRKGVHREHTSKASGGIIRNILQQLGKARLVEKDTNGGRRVTH